MMNKKSNAFDQLAVDLLKKHQAGISYDLGAKGSSILFVKYPEGREDIAEELRTALSLLVLNHAKRATGKKQDMVTLDDARKQTTSLYVTGTGVSEKPNCIEVIADVPPIESAKMLDPFVNFLAENGIRISGLTAHAGGLGMAVNLRTLGHRAR